MMGRFEVLRERPRSNVKIIVYANKGHERDGRRPNKGA